MKVILNKCFGGFGLSVKGHEEYAKKIGKKIFWYNYDFSKDGDITYNKVESSDTNPFSIAFTKDFGENTKITDEDYDQYSLNLNESHREDKTLIDIVEQLGEEADGRFSSLLVVEIPDGMKYEIDEYDGIETLREEHRSW